jgi:hypothetical protein
LPFATGEGTMDLHRLIPSLDIGGIASLALGETVIALSLDLPSFSDVLLTPSLETELLLDVCSIGKFGETGIAVLTVLPSLPAMVFASVFGTLIVGETTIALLTLFPAADITDTPSPPFMFAVPSILLAVTSPAIFTMDGMS